MATKLKNMKLTSVDLVRAGANQEADICLFKSAEGAEQPTEGEKNIFKRFIAWLRENPSEGNEEPEDDHVTKSDDIAKSYAEALSQSIQSINGDETLGGIEKLDMMCKSIGEFYDAIEKLGRYDDDPDDYDDKYDDDPDDAIEDKVEAEMMRRKDKDQYDDIEEL